MSLPGIAVADAPGEQGVDLVELGRYTAEAAEFDEGGAEIVAHDPESQRLFIANGSERTLDILDIADPSAPALVTQVDLSGFGAGINGVGAGGGVIGVAVEPEESQTERGRAVFLDAEGEVLSDVTVGFLPDALIFSPDGRSAVVANEAEPNDDYTVDPEGTVSVIDVSGGAAELTDDDVTEVGFGGVARENLDESVRIFGPDASVAQDIEPENVTFSPDSATTFVTLQENNAIVAIDVASGEITDLFGLGFKDHTDPANGLDASNQDDEINIRNWPVQGIPQPDALAAYDTGGETYLVTANEGDARDYDGFSEEERLADVALCPDFPAYDGMSPEDLQRDENLGRLNITTTNGFDDERECVEQIHAYGGRSFSIYAADGELVYDSGREFEEITAEELGRQGFNANNDEAGEDAFDTRSDDKGPEPEGVAVGEAYGETYAFIGLERVGGVMTYQVSDPAQAQFMDYTTGRVFDVDDAADSVDLGPEGVIFIDEDDSPNGRPLVVLAHEVTGTTTLYQLDLVGGDDDSASDDDGSQVSPVPDGGVETGGGSVSVLGQLGLIGPLGALVAGGAAMVAAGALGIRLRRRDVLR
jgi:hypothetical protein